LRSGGEEKERRNDCCGDQQLIHAQTRRSFTSTFAASTAVAAISIIVSTRWLRSLGCQHEKKAIEFIFQRKFFQQCCDMMTLALGGGGKVSMGKATGNTHACRQNSETPTTAGLVFHATPTKNEIVNIFMFK
jgi:hypothetical protein